MPTDSFSYALERLDPASRALLDLSLRRGMRTEEIAEVLGAEPESVEASRDEALQRIASDVGMDELDEVRARLAELPASDWLGGGNGAPAVAAEEPAEAEDAKAEVAEPPPAEKRRRGILPLLLGLLLIAGAIVAIALATTDNGNGPNASSSAPSQPPKAQKPPAPPKGGAPPVKLLPIGATKATGTVRVSKGKLRLEAGGLAPRGHYQVWLYNSIIDARPIGTGNGSRFTVTAGLPASWKRFRFIDVSREPRDGNLSHSGESVLRVPTKSLR